MALCVNEDHVSDPQQDTHEQQQALQHVGQIIAWMPPTAL